MLRKLFLRNNWVNNIFMREAVVSLFLCADLFIKAMHYKIIFSAFGK